MASYIRPVIGAVVLVLATITSGSRLVAAQESTVTVTGRVALPSGLSASRVQVRVHLSTGGTLSTESDSTGRYRLSSVQVGVISISAERAGAMTGWYGQERWDDPASAVTIRGDSTPPDLDIRLWPLATLEGTVIDDAGDAASEIEVVAIRLDDDTDQPRQVRTRTDDRGRYRLSLAPGGYQVMLPINRSTIPDSISVPGVERSRPTTTLVEGFRLQQPPGFPGTPGLRSETPAPSTTFCPNSLSRLGAVKVTLASGELQQLDCKVQVAPLGVVVGRLTMPDGSVPPVFTELRLVSDELLAAERSTFQDLATWALSDAKGRFAFGGVPRGAYRIQARRLPIAASMFASVQAAPSALEEWTRVWDREEAGAVAAGRPTALRRPVPPGAVPSLGADEPVVVDGKTQPITIALRQLPRIKGQIKLRGRSGDELADLTKGAAIRLTSVGGTLETAVTYYLGTDGRFETYGSPPGRYRVTLEGLPAEWRVVSSTDDTVTEADWPIVDLAEADAAGVTIALSTAPASAGTIAGRVRPDDGKGVAGWTIVAVPAERTFWETERPSPSRLSRCRPSTTGEFFLSGLRPGEYFLLIVASSADQSPSALRELSRTAKRVKISGGATEWVDLAIPTRR